MSHETDVDTGLPNEDKLDEEEQESFNERISESNDCPLYKGEKVVCTASDVTYHDGHDKQKIGTLYITNYKLYFQEDEKNGGSTEYSTLGNISKLEKVGTKQKGDSSTKQKSETGYGLEIVCKDMRNLKFELKHDSNPRRKLFDAIQNNAFPISNGRSFFAFEYQGEDFRVNGWEVYDANRELTRLKVPNDCWRLTNVNKDHRVCDTYPALLAVPASIDDDDIQNCAVFRSRSRLPVLSWLHPNNNASITRCSQPNVGVSVSGRRNKDDEKYIHAIFEANINCTKLFIMDARPKINAVANKARGGGYEDMSDYQNTELVFLDIANIHVMRDSLRKLKDMVFPKVDDTHFFSNLEQTRWLDHLKAVIAGAVRIADTVDRYRTSCIVHCSHGWDRTPQLTSLAMLLLDPYYRTIVGFEVLIEKEWCSFGHKFGQRYGLGDKNHSDDQRSPIFIQFIDAVWQITRQFPCAFEFNEHFLVTVLTHLHSCLFGTFLYNSEAERIKEDVSGKTQSLWSYINTNMEDFTNPSYAQMFHQHVLLPVASIRYLTLWKAYHMRWNPKRPQESMGSINRILSTRIKMLRNMCENLQSELDARATVQVSPGTSETRNATEAWKPVSAQG